MRPRILIAFALASVAAALCGGWAFMSLSALATRTDPRPFVWIVGGLAGAIFCLPPASFLCALGVGLFGLPAHIFLKRARMTEFEDYMLAGLVVSGGVAMSVFLTSLHQPFSERWSMPAGIFVGGLAAAATFRSVLGFRVRRARALRGS